MRYNDGNKNNATKYVGNPYNFASFPEDVIDLNKASGTPEKPENVDHSRIDDSKFSGRISFSINSVTPLFVGGYDGEHFYKNTDGKYAIPGSTIKGLVRENIQILSHGTPEDEIEDINIMYRNIAAGEKRLQKKYGEILGTDQAPVGEGERSSLCKNAIAGYISREGDSFIIYDTTEHEQDKTNYYPVKETVILKSIEDKGKESPFYYIKDFLQNKLTPEGKSPFTKYIKCKDCENCTKTNKTQNGCQIETKDKAIEEGLLSEGADKNNNPCLICSEDKEVVIHNISSCENEMYKPFSIPVSYNIDPSTQKILGIYPPDSDEGDKKGYVLESGPMNEKKTLYVIPEMDCKRTIKKMDQNDKSIKSFMVDYQGKEHTLGTTSSYFIKYLKQYEKSLRTEGEKKGYTGERLRSFITKEIDDKKAEYREFYKLPEKDSTITSKPIFYIEGDEKRFYFGFTPYLRLFYKHSTKEGLPKGLKSTKDHIIFDFARTMLGYSDDKGKVKWKSRVFFENAVIEENNPKAEKKTVVLGEPKPSSYLDYVRQKDCYEDDGFRLRGYKQYWLRNGIKPDEGVQRDNVSSRFSPLPKGTVFKASVKFNSLTKEELGLLLWAIQLDEGCDLNIGKAKPLGYGRIHISNLKLDLVDFAKMYEADMFSFEPYRQGDASDFISYYKEYVKENFKLDVENDLSIHEFLLMKNQENPKDKTKINYMQLKDYYKRKQQLQTVDEVLETGKYKEEAKPHDHRQSSGNNGGYGGGKSQGGDKKVSPSNFAYQGRESGNFSNGRRGPIKPRDRRV